MTQDRQEAIKQMSDEEKVEFIEAAAKAVMGAFAAQMMEDPSGTLDAMKIVEARRETSGWATHRTSEGYA